MTASEKSVLLQQLDGMNDTPFSRYLQECLDRHMLEAVQGKDDVTLRWSQGKAQFILELMQDITTARDQLNKMGQRRPSMDKAF